MSIFFTPTSLINIVGVNGLSSDRLYTFDNGPEISPFYPVIASIWKKSKHELRIRNNFEEALAVIEKFKRRSEELVLKLQKKIKKIFDSTPEGRLAIWGGIHTSQLLSETVLKQAGIACIFDNDPKKQGSRLFGHKIEKFSRNPGQVKKRIDSILISSEASEDTIYEQISYLENHGIKIYRLYR